MFTGAKTSSDHHHGLQELLQILVPVYYCTVWNQQDLASEWISKYDYLGHIFQTVKEQSFPLLQSDSPKPPSTGAAMATGCGAHRAVMEVSSR